MTFLLFLFWLVILIAEGSLAASLILRSKVFHPLILTLSLPLSALCNVFVVFLYTITGIPLMFWTMVLGHGVIMGILLIMMLKKWCVVIGEPCAPLGSTEIKIISHFQLTIFNYQFFLRVVCITLLTVQCIFSFAHAVILPTYHIDSLTNWTMRSKVSFYDRAIAFDATEARGVAKPQYPIVFHALQITVNEGKSEWSDRSATAILFFLTLSAFTALFLLIKGKKGVDHALAIITLITGIPLLTLHLSQGYGDLPLVLLLCLSFITLWLYRSESDARWLLLSGLLMAASVWTKAEGLFVGLIPWMLLVIADCKTPERRQQIWKPALISTLIALMFPMFLLSRGLGLTPHGSDSRLEWHPEIIDDIVSGLFASGSMGIVWYVIAIASGLILWLRYRGDVRVERSAMMLGWWALFSLLLIIGTYVCTPNASFVANGESYYRQLMIPASLFLLWLGLGYKSPHARPVPDQS